MKKRGFTLIELLAVIIILVIMLVVAMPNILKILDQVKIDIYNNHMELFNEAAGEYVKLYPDEFEDPNEAVVFLNMLMDKSLIERNIINPITDKPYENIGIIVKKINGRYVYEILEPTAPSKVYGVYFDGTSSTAVRTDDAVGLKYKVNASTITSDFDNAEIYGEITEETDSYGNVFVKIPKFWIKKTVVGDTWKYQISKTKQDSGYYLPSCFYDEASRKILPYVLVGKYNASLNVDKLESKSGTLPLVSKTIAQFRTYARANNTGGNDGYQILDIHVIDILQVLFYIEFATLRSQSIMYGYANDNFSALKSGTTDSVSTYSGSPTSNSDGKYAMKYRGIENLYGNIWQFIDGINIKDNQAYVAVDASLYQSDKYDGTYNQLGYANANTVNFILKMGYDSNNPFIQLPISVGTYANSLYKDYYFQNPGNRIVTFGGWSAGYAGISSWHLSGPPENFSSAMGSRLVKTPL